MSYLLTLTIFNIFFTLALFIQLYQPYIGILLGRLKVMGFSAYDTQLTVNCQHFELESEIVRLVFDFQPTFNDRLPLLPRLIERRSRSTFIIKATYMKKIFLILFFCSLLFSSFTSQSIQKLPKPGEELLVYLARVDLPKKT